MKIKILQWNKWFKEDPENVIDFLRKIDADIYSLQELNIESPTNEFDLIKRELGINGVVGITETDFGKHANGIFSRFEIKNSFTSFIKDPATDRQHFSDEGRIYVEAEIDLDGKILNIGTTHMSYTDAFVENQEKKEEADKLVKLIKNKESYIFSGDLNATEDSYTVGEVEKQLVNCGPDYSQKTWTTKPFSYNGFEENGLNWRLDYIFATKDIQVISSKIMETDYSDHLPILAEIEV